MKSILNKFYHLSLYSLYSKIKKINKNKDVNQKGLKNSLTVGRSEKYNLILLHNPKVAGTSLMNVLEIPMFYNHQLPLRRYTVEDWESNRFLLVVRHPIDRLVSAYYFHTGEKYQGGYMRLFPNLKSIGSLYDYFWSVVTIEAGITPQYNYAYRPGSDKKADFILKFENLDNDLKSKLGIETTLTKKNQTIRAKKPRLSSKELDIILSYYNVDFEMFGYSKEDSNNFVEIYEE